MPIRTMARTAASPMQRLPFHFQRPPFFHQKIHSIVRCRPKVFQLIATDCRPIAHPRRKKAPARSFWMGL